MGCVVVVVVVGRRREGGEARAQDSEAECVNKWWVGEMWLLFN